MRSVASGNLRYEATDYAIVRVVALSEPDSASSTKVAVGQPSESGEACIIVKEMSICIQ